MWIFLAALARATPLDDDEAACIRLDLTRQAACWAGLEQRHPWSGRRLDWELRQVELGRTQQDRQAERRARRALAELRAGGWWVARSDGVKAADAQKAAEELRLPVSDEPAIDPAAMGVSVPSGVSGAASRLATDDPAIWKAAGEAFHRVMDPEQGSAALLWEAWCLWNLGEAAEAMAVQSRAVDLAEDADRPDWIRREIEDQSLLFRSAAAWRPDLMKWAKQQPVDVEAAAAARLRELGSFADAVSLWRHLLERAPMDARAPLWHFALLRDLLDPEARKAELPKMISSYGSGGSWWEQQGAEARDGATRLIGRIFPHRPETFGEAPAP